MRGKNKVAIGFMAMVAVTGMVNVSSSFASDIGQVTTTKRIGHGGSTYQSKSAQASKCPVKADVVERWSRRINVSLQSARRLSGCRR